MKKNEFSKELPFNLKRITVFLFAISMTLVVGCQDPKNPRVTGEAPPPPKYPTQIQEPPPQVQDELLPDAPPLPPPSTLPRIKEAPPKPQPKTKHSQSGNLQGNGPVKMDILFVIDTSESMRCDQENLSKNINQFVNQITRNDKVDFHIGATAVWDSKSYGDAPRKFKNGELRPISDGSSQRYITKKNSNLLGKSLKLGVEPLRYLQGDSGAKNPKITGPEFEELFSPILAAFSDEMTQGSNRGFRRPDAHLAVIIITDTGDLTPDPLNSNRILVAEQVKESLVKHFEQFKNQDNSVATTNLTVSVSAALARLDEWMQFSENKSPGNTLWTQKYSPNPNDGCYRQTKTANGKTKTKFELNKVDPDIAGPYGRPPEAVNTTSVTSSISPSDSTEARNDLDFKMQLEGPKQIYELTKQMDGEAFDLQSRNFGKKLADLGGNLFKKSVNFRIPLERPLDMNEKVEISINKSKLKKADWFYIPESQVIQLNENAMAFDSSTRKQKQLKEFSNFDYTLNYTVLD